MKKYRIERKPLNEVRKKYIWKIVENLENQKFGADIKNLMQSFVYLILNDKFQKHILELRDSLLIPENGCLKNEWYKQWNTNENRKEVEQEAKKFILKHKLCYKQHEPLVIDIISRYILLKDFEPQDEAELTGKKLGYVSYHSFVGGWDVPDPFLGKENTKDFDKVLWEIYVHPTDNLTRVRNSLRHYFAWMMPYHFKNGFDQQWFERKNRDVIKNWNPRLKKPIKLSLSPQRKKARVALKFQSYLNTKTKDILREFDKYRSKIRIFQKELKSGQIDKRELTFDKKIKHYFQYLEGLSPAKVEWENRKNKMPEERRDLRFKKRINQIKTSYNEVRKNVDRAFKIKLSL